MALKLSGDHYGIAAPPAPHYENRLQLSVGVRQQRMFFSRSAFLAFVAFLAPSLGTVACRVEPRAEEPSTQKAPAQEPPGQEPPLQPPVSRLIRTATPVGLVGCYALFDHRGRPAAESLYWAPAATRLDTIPPHQAWKLDAHGRRMVPADRPLEPLPSWAVDSLTDTVRIEFHSGLSGTVFVLGFRRGRDTLRGRAEGHWDMGPPWVTDAGAASAVRIRCGE